MTVRLPLVSTSELRALRRCKRLHHYTYRLGYRPIDKAGPLRFGTAIHKALETWFSPATFCDLQAALAAIDVGEIDVFERARARAMMMAYHTRWVDAAIEVLAVEAEFRTSIVNPETGHTSKTFELGGKIDAVIRQPNGDVYLLEHKSTSIEVGYETTYWKRLRIDPQISTYFVGARALGYDVKGALYDVLRKPAQKPYRATPPELQRWTKVTAKNPVSRLYEGQRDRDETPEEFEDRCFDVITKDPDKYLLRGAVYRSEQDENEAAEDMWHQVRELRDSARAKAFPRNPDGCEIYGRLCEMFDVCCGIASLDDPSLFKRIPRKHEELTL